MDVDGPCGDTQGPWIVGDLPLGCQHPYGLALEICCQAGASDQSLQWGLAGSAAPRVSYHRVIKPSISHPEGSEDGADSMLRLDLELGQPGAPGSWGSGGLSLLLTCCKLGGQQDGGPLPCYFLGFVFCSYPCSL